MTLILDSNLLPTKDAAALSGYNADYLSRLCRSGKIAGTQVGRTWLINRESLEQFVREQEERKQQISAELSQTREKEYKHAQRGAPARMARVQKEAAGGPVLSPFTAFVRTPAAALFLSILIMATSAYAATFGPVAAVMEHAGALASAAQQTITGGTQATAPRLRIASNVSASAQSGIPVVRSANVRPLAPTIDGASIAKQLALIDVPEARAETDGYRIVAYDAAAGNAAALQSSRAQTERALSRFMASDEPISARVADAYDAVSSGTRDAYATVLDTYGFSLNRAGDTSLAFAADARDAVTRSPEVSGALLDAYSNSMYAWVDGTQTLAARTADTEVATGPAVLAFADTAQQQTHALALAAQSAVDGQLGSAHGAASLALDAVPHVASQAAGTVAAVGATAPRVLPQNIVAAEATTAPAQIVASAGAFSPFDGISFLAQGSQIALATFNAIHDFSRSVRFAFANFSGHLFGGTRLAVVELPPAVTVPGYTVRVPEGGPAAPDYTGSYTGGAITHVTNVSNYFSANGVTKQVLDQAISSALSSIHGGGGGGGGTTIVQGGGGFSGGDLTAANIHGTGSTTIDGALTLGGTLTSAGEIIAPFFTATSLAATSTLPNIISNSFSIGGDTIRDFTGTGLAIVNGVLTATATTSNSFQQGGNIFGTTATLGTQDTNPLAFITNNIARMTIDASGNVGVGTTSTASLLSVGGTVTADAFAAQGTGTSTLPRVASVALALGNDYVTGFTGNGLSILGGVLGLDAGNNYFSTTSSNFWLGTKTTDALAEGSTNLYFTNARADARINATSTIGTLTSAPNLGTVATSLTGILKATSGILSAATAGIDYENPLTFAYPLVRSANSLSLAFGTTTANSWSQLQKFNGGASTTALTVTGNTYLGTVTAGNATTTTLNTNTFGLGGAYFSSLLGSGLLNAGGVLTLDRTGNWTGMFGGQVPGYYTNISNQTGVLGQANGGTGIASFTAGDILYADNTGTLAVLPVGGPGSVLKIQAGLPQWGVDQTIGGGGSDGIFATSSGKIYPLDTSNTLVIGSNATSTSNSIFEVNGQGYFSTKLSIATTTAPAALSVGGSGYFTGGLGIGVLNTVAGTLRTSGNATIGGALQVTGNATLAAATSTSFNTNVLGLGGTSYFTSLTGSGLTNVGGVLTLDRTGDWTGTFAGLTSSYYLNAANLTNFGTPFYALFHATTTDALAEGITNLYFTNARADARINATSTIGTLTSAPNLGTVSTSLSGLLKATAGVLSVASAGTDFAAPFTATYPIQYSANNLSLAFGTTTANTWGALQTFGAGFVSQASSTVNSTLTVTGAVTAPSFGSNTNAANITFPSGNVSLNTSGGVSLLWNGVSITGGVDNARDLGTIALRFRTAYLATSLLVGSSAGDHFIVTSGGNVGIGSTTPGSLLSIGSTNGINFSTATSTFSSTGGINLAAGCFAVNGVCLANFSNTLANGGTATTTFYNGGVVFSDGTKLTQSSSPANFFWDETNKRLGLGTSSPSQVLSVQGNGLFSGNISATNITGTGNAQINGGLGIGVANAAAGTIQSSGAITTGSQFIGLASDGASAPSFTWGGDLSTGLYHAAANAIGFSTSGIERARIDGNGFLGIGTSTPGSLLSIGSTNGINFSTATSTFSSSGGINLAAGCFAVNGTCVGTNAGTVISVNASGGTTGLTFSGGPVTSSGVLTLAGTLAVANGGTGSTTLSGLLVGNGTSALNTLTLPSFLSLSGSTLSLGTLGIANGGTGTTTGGVTNGVEYFNGTTLTNGSNLTFNGTSLGVGSTSPWAQLSINPNGITGPAFAIGSSTGTSFVVTNGGLVGIGTTSPAATLSLQGASVASGNAPLALLVQGGAGGSLGAGGNLTLLTGNGGTGAAGSGGPTTLQGGTFTLTGGTGGANSSAGSTQSGTGGVLNLIGGVGGNNSIGGSFGGSGGAINLTGGNAGNSISGGSGFGGSGGTVVITGGKGGTGNTGTGFGGSILLSGGLSGLSQDTSSVGSLSVGGGVAGAVSITAGNSTSNFFSGGAFTIQTGNGGTGGGNIAFTGGNASSTGNGGSFAFTGGIASSSTANAFGGSVTLTGGAASSTVSSVSGGPVTITGGSGGTGTLTNGSGGSITLNGGGGGIAGGSVGNVILANLRGNVGIGTTTPGSLLSINGIANFTAATSTFYGTGGINLAAGCYAVNGTCLTNNFQAPLTFAYPLLNTANVISLAFGTTTANTWSALQTFNGGAIGSSFTATGQFIGLASDGASAPSFTWGGDLSTGLYHAAANAIGFSTSGIERARIDGNGFLGIGTSSPYASLSVSATLNATPFAIASSSGATMFAINPSGSATFGDGLTSSIFINGGGTTSASYAASNNVAIGNQAFSYYDASSATDNIAFGYQALYGSPTARMTGGYNFAAGNQALFSNTSGSSNAAVGFNALFSNISGSNNNAFGFQALNANTTGSANNAFGGQSLIANTTGSGNNALGPNALGSNTTGSSNNAFGNLALPSNSTGSSNNALGNHALTSNTTGSFNTALGSNALFNLTTGYDNIMIGEVANTGGNNITTGKNNILLGYNAGIGTSTNSTGFLNIGNSFFGSMIATTTSTSLPTSFANVAFAIATSSLTGSTFSVQNSSATNNVASFFSNAGAPLLNISNAGNVGIGTTTPGSLLSINGIANFTAATSTFYGTGGINLAAGCYAINGNCLTLGSFGGTLGLANGGTATTTFYNGGVVFSDGTKLTQAASPSSFFWDNTNKRLGLGTSTPWAQLSINPNGITGPAFAIGSSTGTSFVVTNAGRVGIGTTSPLAALSIQGASVSSGDAPNALFVQTGNGGSTGSIGGVAGYVALLGGTGGTGSVLGGGGGAFSFTGGAGGAGGSGGGLGGDFRATAGAGGLPNGNGGVIALTGGAGNDSIGSGGSVILSGGAGALDSGTGGSFILNGGTGGSISGGTGGGFTLNGGAGGNGGGGFTFNGGSATLLGNGGGFTVTGGTASTTSSNRTGGAITFTGGSGGTGTLTNGNGGSITLNGGVAGIAGGSVGNVLLATLRGNVGIGSTTPGSLLSIGTTNGINFSTATSTFSSTGGINLAAGCFAVNGICINNFSNTLANGGTATSTFYNGGVVFSDGTKLTQSSAASNFFWDETNKRLGLGTSTPWAQLSINPNGITGPAFAIGSSTGTSFVVTNAGRVGIGTSSPFAALSIQGASAAVGDASSTLFVQGGNGGSGTIGGIGGYIRLFGGTGGTGSVLGGGGGDFAFTGGTGGGGSSNGGGGGGFAVTGGTGGSSNGNGGSINLAGGAGNGSVGTGGSISLAAGAGATNGAGGSFSLSAGTSNGGNGGDFTFNGGNGGTTGGGFTFNGGNDTLTGFGNGGGFTVTGGTASTTDSTVSGGALILTGGSGGTGPNSAGSGGNLVFDGGAAGIVGGSIGNILLASTRGSVAIGTTSPYSKLAVWGNSTGNIFEAITSASSSALRVSGTGFGTTTVTGLRINGSATTTSNVGINLTGGCFAVNGVCIGGATGGGTGTVTSIDASGGTTGLTFSGGPVTSSGVLTLAGTLDIANGGTGTTTGGVTNGVEYFNGTTLTNGSNLTFNGTSLGIGTTTPGSLLSIGNTNGINFSTGTSTFSSTGGINLSGGCYALNGTCIGGNALSFAYPLLNTANVISLAFGTTTANSWSALQTFGAGFISQASSTITGAFNVSGTSYFGGNVGIGTTTAAQLLTLSAADSGTSLTTAALASESIINSDTTNNNTADLVFKTADTAGATVVGTKFATVFTSHAPGAVSADLVILTRNAGTLGERARITATGNFGIGTTTPSQTLTVQGNALLSGNLTAANVTATGTVTFSGLGTGFVKSTSGVLSIDNSTYLTSAVTAIGPTGQIQTGPTVTFATSTSATTGLTTALTITGSGNTLTFAPTLSGTLAIANGGTGTTTGGVTNGVEYFNGTTLTNGSNLTFNGTSLGIGSTSPWAQLSVNAAGGAAPAFAIGSSSATLLSIDQIGNLDVGTSSNQGFHIVNNAFTAGNGLSITTSQAGSGVSLGVVSANTSENLSINAKGSSGAINIGNISAGSIRIGNTTTPSSFINISLTQTFSVQTGGFIRAAFTDSALTLTPAARTAVTPFFGLTAAAGSNLTASTEAPLVNFNLAGIQSHSTGAIAIQRQFRLSPGTETFTNGTNAANTIASTSAFEIDGTPIQGTLANFTNAYGLFINNLSTLTAASTTNAYGLAVQAPVGALNNYAAEFLGTVGISTTTPWGRLSIDTSGLAAGVPSFVVGSSTRTDLVVTQSGNVGINTTNPQAKLEVNGVTILGAGTQANMPSTGSTYLTGNVPSGDVSGLVLYNAGGGAGASVSIDFYNTNANNIPQAKIKAIDDGSFSDNLLFLTKIPGGFSNGIAERARLTSTGNFGVGTTSPWGQLSASSTGSNPALAIQQNSTGPSAIFLGGNVGIATSTPGSLLSINGIANFTAATSTFYGTGGINLTGGCFAINGTCIGNGVGTPGSGTVTSIDASGGTTGLTFSGGPVTSSGVLTLAGTLGIANGGTGTTTQVTGGVNYFDGTRITSGTGLTFNGTNLGIGTTTPGSLLSIGGNVFIGASATNNTGGTLTLQSTSTTAFAVGANGAGNPVLAIDASAASQVSGLVIKGGATGVGPTITVTDSAANVGLTITGKGTGVANYLAAAGGVAIFGIASNAKMQLTASSIAFSGLANLATAATVRYSWVGTADTNLTASTEAPSTYFNLGQIRSHASGAIVIQRDFRLTPSTHTFTAGTNNANSTIASSSALSIDGPPGQGVNVNYTNAIGLYIGPGTAYTSASTTNAIGIVVDAPAGAANNYAALFGGGNVGIGTTSPWAQLSINPNGITGPAFAIGSSSGTSFLVSSGGQVGIGTTTPGSLLSIGGVANFTTATSTFYGTGGINLTSGCYAVNGTCIGGSSFSNTLANGGTATTSFYTGGVVFSDGTKLTQAANTGINSFFWDNTNGRLGIGTSTPNWALSVSGTSGVRFKSTTGITNAFVVENSVGTSTLQVDTLDNASSIFSVATSSGATYFYIDASGNTAIGTTTPTAQFVTTGTVRLAGFGAGTLTTDALGNVTAASDERLKDINGTFGRGLAELMQLNPILYHWNATSSLDTGTQYAGFSAQNVQSVIPEAVDVGPKGYLSLQDRPILAASVNAIKELAGRTDALSLSTTTLAARVSSIESALTASQGSQPKPVAATTISADSVHANSLSINGNAFATSFVAPATPIAFTVGSTTGTIPNEVLTDSGDVDLYKAATYAITGVQSLIAQTTALASRVDAVELRVTMLEAIASSTPATNSGMLSFATFTDLLGQIGVIVKDGIAHFTSLAFTNLIAAPAADGTSAVATSTIPMGDTQLVVANNLAHPSSKIFVTITSPLTGSWYVSQKSEGSFTINLSSPQTSAVTFDYFIVQTEGSTQVANAASAPGNVGQVSVGTADPNATTTPAAATSTETATPSAAPTISLNGDAAVDIAQGGFWTDPGATATDAAGNDLTAKIAVTGSVDSSTAGLYTINYSVVDAAGVSAGVSRVVHVSAPTVAPADSGTSAAPSGPDTGTGAVTDASVPAAPSGP